MKNHNIVSISVGLLLFALVLNLSIAGVAKAFSFSGFGSPTSKDGKTIPNLSVDFGGTSSICDSGHYGQDYPMGLDALVYPAADGVVYKVANWDPSTSSTSHGWGGVVIIRHDISQSYYKFKTENTALSKDSKITENPQVVYTMYAHLYNIKVKEGDRVYKGGGNIGQISLVHYKYKGQERTYPLHLHFEIKDQTVMDDKDAIIGNVAGIGNSCSPMPGRIDNHYKPSEFIKNNASPIVIFNENISATSQSKKNSILEMITQIRARINDLLAQLSKTINPVVQKNLPINSQPAVPVAGTKSVAVAQGLTINFVSYPIGAKVSVDGVVRGTAPLAADNISTGWHNIIFSKTGYQECQKTVLIAGSQMVSCNLNPLPNTTANVQIYNKNGTPDVDTQSQVKKAVPFSTLTADLGGVAYGTGTTLRWSSSNATGCTASGGWSGAKALSGSQDTGPLYSTQTFILNCTGPGGSVTQQTLVSVSNPPVVATANILAPTLKFTAPLTWVMYGQGTTLKWSSSNAASCTASGGWSGDEPLEGSKDTGPLYSTNTFVLTCVGTGGSVNRSVSIGIKNAPTLAVTDVYAATQGDNFNLSGSNFSPNGRVTLHFARASGNFYPDQYVQADPYGKIAYSWPVPSDAIPGNSSVSATDDTNGMQTSSIGFRIVAAAQTTGNLTLSVSPASGSLGTIFTVSGANFTPNSAVMIHFENADIGQFLIRQPASDANGNISYNWNSAANTVSGVVSIWAVDNGTGRNSPKVSVQITAQ